MLVIRPLAGSDSIPEITALLHAAYGQLAAMGFRYTASHQDDAVTERRLHRGHPFVAEFEGRLAGTVTLHKPGPDSDCEWYRRSNVMVFGQFGVNPEFQRRGIGRRLFDHVESFARELGAASLALDTAENASHLVRWYESLGFHTVQHVSWHDTNYRSVIMDKPLT